MPLNGLDILADLAKSLTSRPAPAAPVEARKSMSRAEVVAFYVNRERARRAQASTGVVKAAGPGGVQFDFGPMTGNPVADRTTLLLNQFIDPVQEQTAKDQRREISKAFTDYIHMGEAAWNAKSGSQSGMAEWNQVLSKSTDETIKAMHAAGQLEADGPALINKHNETQIQVGGELVKATSETDAALIEMMKNGMSGEGE